ncbi:MAG: hypothetical protein J1E96_06290 [Ruminococcus sp.]|nr:hypothetical protein [Ruminococcus sp.]
MSTLYLHIGMPKTGTSYIQNFLRLNNDTLKQKGYVYPDFGIRFGKIGINRNGHFLVSVIRDEDRNRLKKEEKRIENECFDKLFDLLDEYPNAILSEESIWNSGERTRGKDFWTNLRNRLNAHDVEIKVIVYLRRQDLFIQSFWAQHVKETGLSETIQEYLSGKRFKRLKLDYYDRLNTISDVIGKENMLVRVYEKNQYIGPEKTIISDFLTTVGLEYTDEYVQPPRLSNTSLTGIYLETKRELNKIEGLVERKGYIQDLIKKVVVLNDDVRPISSNEFMTGEEAVALLKRYEESNSNVAREYLGREDGKLFFEEQKITNDSLPEYTTSDYMNVIAQMIALQNTKSNETAELIRDLKAEVKELKEENKKLQSTVDWVTTSFPKKVTRKLKRILGIKRNA